MFVNSFLDILNYVLNLFLKYDDIEFIMVYLSKYFYF